MTYFGAENYLHKSTDAKKYTTFMFVNVNVNNKEGGHLTTHTPV